MPRSLNDPVGLSPSTFQCTVQPVCSESRAAWLDARLSEQTGCTVYLKVEGLNPTGSFKDRGMTMAVTEAVARGQKAVLCASTGNTSASAAAYAARAGITCAVLIPQGKIAMGKLAQAVMHGAKILQMAVSYTHLTLPTKR